MAEEGTGAYLTLAVESLEAEVESLREQLTQARLCVRIEKTAREAAEAKLAEIEEERDKTEEYAKEGWDWLSEALDALGAETVFDIAKRKVSMGRARELLRDIDEWARKPEGEAKLRLIQAYAALDDLARLLSGDEAKPKFYGDDHDD